MKERAIRKWSAFNSDVFDITEEYVLLVSNCEETQFLPGGEAKFFTLRGTKRNLERTAVR